MKNLSLNEINVTGGEKCFVCHCRVINSFHPKYIPCPTVEDPGRCFVAFHATGREKIIFKPGKGWDVIEQCMKSCYNEGMVFDALIDTPC